MASTRKALCDEGTSSLLRTVSEECRTSYLQRSKVQQVVNGFAEAAERKGADLGFNLESKLKQLRCLTCPIRDSTLESSPCLADDDEVPVNPIQDQAVTKAVNKIAEATSDLMSVVFADKDMGPQEKMTTMDQKMAQWVLQALFKPMNDLQRLTCSLELHEKVDVLPLFNEIIETIDKALPVDPKIKAFSASSQSGSTPAPEETRHEAKLDAQASVDALHRLMDSVGKLEDKAMDAKYLAEFELKKCEDEYASQWKQKFVACERSYKSWVACVGLRLSLRIATERIEDMETPRSEAHEAPTDPDGSLETEPAPEPSTNRAFGSLPIVYEAMLSDYFEEGNIDPKEREEVLKTKHPGSKDHPDGCRPCHFQAGLCWKGLSCSFCHICPKPKRKSKHQRDVDKRRQERYKEVKDKLGEKCLDDMTRIDDFRRQLMTASEDLKQFGKDAYSQMVGPGASIDEKLSQFQEMIETWSQFANMIQGLVPRREVDPMEASTASGEFEPGTASSDTASTSGLSTSERASSSTACVGGMKSRVFDTHTATKSQKQTKTYPLWPPQSVYGAWGPAPYANFACGESSGWLDTRQWQPNVPAWEADQSGAHYSGTKQWPNDLCMSGADSVEEHAWDQSASTHQ